MFTTHTISRSFPVLSLVLVLASQASSQTSAQLILPWQEPQKRDPADIARIMGPIEQREPSRDLNILWVWGIDQFHDQSPPMISSMLATAGGVVFGGDLNRSFMAFDDLTGKVLWRIELDDLPSSNIVSYRVGGKQYVAVVVGETNYHVDGWSRTYHRFAEQLGMPVNDAPRGGAAIWTFSL